MLRNKIVSQVANIMPTRANFFFRIAVILLVLGHPLLSRGNDAKVGEWHLLSENNFSSAIKLCPRMLILLFNPWSGDARSMMREISELLRENEVELGSLQLRYVHKNKERTLAEAITGEIEDGKPVKVIYYHNSQPYWYRGALSAKSIIFSVRPYISGRMEIWDGVPATRLNTKEEVDEFLRSTDKAVILLEGCGWTDKLLDEIGKMGNDRGSDEMFEYKDKFYAAGSELYASNLIRGDEKQKETENSRMVCARESGLSSLPWFLQLYAMNGVSLVPNGSVAEDNNYVHNDSVVETKDGAMNLSCSVGEFKQFYILYSKFINVARQFFLPSVKQRFGIVTETSLLQSFGIEDPRLWHAMLYVNGCPTCSKVFKEKDMLLSVLQDAKYIVRELEDDIIDLNPVLPANSPSVVLFVDRSSSSQELRVKGNEALDVFRELALRYTMSRQIKLLKDEESETLFNDKHKVDAKSTYEEVKFSSLTSRRKVESKYSVMILGDHKYSILNDDVPHAAGNSFQDLLVRILQRKEVTKLSSVAQEVGFQLISEDVNVKLDNFASTEPESDARPASLVNQLSPEHQPVMYNAEESIAVNEPTEGSLPVSSENIVLESDLRFDRDLFRTREVIASEVLFGGEELQAHRFNGSFFFCDGRYQLLSSLTGETTIPSLTIIDATSKLHYVFPKENDFNFSSIGNFINEFLEGRLYSYYKLAHKTRRLYPAQHLHDGDFIPQITAKILMQKVLGFHDSDYKVIKKRKQDVLILLSNHWCGFCQRMHLVVREVYKAIQAYAKSRTGESMNRETSKDGDILEIPEIFELDCTLDDCTMVLRSLDLRDVYPTVILIPVGKEEPVLFSGSVAVTDILRFMVQQGGASHHLAEILTETMRESQENSRVRSSAFEVSLEDGIPRSRMKYGPQEDRTIVANVMVGSILVATENIKGQPFESSEILIVKANENVFEGLICNKPMSWNSMKRFERDFELLSKTTLYFGGPLMQFGLPLVALTRTAVDSETPEVKPDVFYLDQTATERQISKIKEGIADPSDYVFFFGFAKWDWAQLFDEIADGMWNVSHRLEHFLWP